MRGSHPLGSARASIFTPAVAIALIWGSGLAAAATKHTALSAKEPFPYNTSGVVNIGADPSSVSGPAVLQFQGLTGATFNPTVKQPISLGQFVLSPSSSTGGQITTYTDTPFEVQVQAPEFNKSSSVPLLDQLDPSLNKKLNLKSVVENSLLLTGHLDGTVGANGQVNVTATVDAIKLGSISGPGTTEAVHYTFPIRYSQFVLPANFVMSNSSTSVTVPTSAPNPIMNPMVSATSTTTSTVAPAPAALMVTVANPTSASTPATTSPLPVPAPEPSTIVFFAVVLGGAVLGRRRLSSR